MLALAQLSAAVINPMVRGRLRSRGMLGKDGMADGPVHVSLNRRGRPLSATSQACRDRCQIQWSRDKTPGPRHRRTSSIAAHWMCVGQAWG